MSIKAMKQALDALESIWVYGADTLSGPVRGQPDDRKFQRDGVAEMTKRARLGKEALRQAIEAAEKQEPVAWIDRTCLKNLSDDFEPTIGKRPVSEYDIPLYIHPQPKSEWVGKEVAPKELSQKFLEEIVESRVVALEAKLREKNGC